MQFKKVIPVILFAAVVLLWAAFSPEPAKAQFILSGDYDGHLSALNLHRTISDSLNSKAINFAGFGELDMNYLHKKWNVYGSIFATYNKGTSLSTIETPGSFHLGFFEAWFMYHLSKNFSIQAGRIEISYSDEAFFQARDWSGLVTSHNAIIAHYLIPDTSVMADLGFAANKFDPGNGVFSTNRTVNSYRYMSYLYLRKRLFDDQLALTLMDIFNADDNGVQQSLLYGRNTLGLTGWLSLDDWDISLGGNYQFGHVSDGRNLSAWYTALYVSYQPTSWLSLMPAFEHLSGDNFADSAEWKKTVHGFSILYGNMTRSFGNASVLSNSYKLNLHPGLNNLYFTATFDVLENFSIEASYHWFSLAHPYIREFNRDSLRIEIMKVPLSFMHQAEVTFTYTPVPAIVLTLDYQLLFPGAAMANYNGWNFNPGVPVSTAYIEIEWTPVFYPRKKRHLLFPPGSPATNHG